MQDHDGVIIIYAQTVIAVQSLVDMPHFIYGQPFAQNQYGALLYDRIGDGDLSVIDRNARKSVYLVSVGKLDIFRDLIEYDLRLIAESRVPPALLIA